MKLDRIKDVKLRMLKQLEKRGFYFYKKTMINGMKVPKKYENHLKLLFKLAELGGKDKEEILHKIEENIKGKLSVRKFLGNRYRILINMENLPRTLKMIEKEIEVENLKNNARILNLLMNLKEAKARDEKIYKVLKNKLEGIRNDELIERFLMLENLEYKEFAINLLRIRNIPYETAYGLAKEIEERKRRNSELSMKINENYVKIIIKELYKAAKRLSRKKSTPLTIEEIKHETSKAIIHEEEKIKKRLYEVRSWIEKMKREGKERGLNALRQEARMLEKKKETLFWKRIAYGIIFDLEDRKKQFINIMAEFNRTQFS